jgi:hypothetical protein
MGGGFGAILGEKKNQIWTSENKIKIKNSPFEVFEVERTSWGSGC